MVNVRIRGIYATALTRLLLDHGFKIVQPSAPINERFNLPTMLENNSPFDIDIYDRLDRQGVNALGDTDSAETLVSVLQETFDDVIIRCRLSLFSESNYPSIQLDISREMEASTSLRRTRFNIEFPGASKKKMDSIRGLVTPTLDGHHYFKACNDRIDSLLEMAEKMLEKGCTREEVESLFKETVEREFPDEGSKIGMEHVKIDGRIFHLGEAEIVKLDGLNGRIRLLRTFTVKGVYDGLKTLKEPGDYAVTDVTIGEWSFRTRYFSKEGVYKGTYVNLNTPIEMYPAKIRYIDLETDVCLWPNGKVRQIDQEKLDKMINEGYVSERLGQIVKGKVEEILNSLNLNAEKDNSFADLWWQA